MPRQKRGESKQDYGTPDDFVAAVQKRFGYIDVDLAAHQDNHLVEDYLGPGSQWGQDTFLVDWMDFGTSSNFFLNPEFSNIAPYAKRCMENAPALNGGLIHLLVPASVGSNWFAKYVHRHAMVLVLNGRLTFKGIPPNPETGKVDGYIKDCMLCVYGMQPGFDVWPWRKEK